MTPPPDTRQINDGVRQLQELGAMDEQRGITQLGQRLACLPCDPKLGRMLLAAAKLHCLSEMLIVAAFLAVQDPRERPADVQAQADAAAKKAAQAQADQAKLAAQHQAQLHAQAVQAAQTQATAAHTAAGKAAHQKAQAQAAADKATNATTAAHANPTNEQ